MTFLLSFIDKVQTEVQRAACSFNASANVTITEDAGAVTIQGSSKNCKVSYNYFFEVITFLGFGAF